MYGQLPRVGISSLHLDAALIDSLATEAQLNRVVRYKGQVDAIDTDDEDLDEVEEDEEEEEEEAAADEVAPAADEVVADVVEEAQPMAILADEAEEPVASVGVGAAFASAFASAATKTGNASDTSDGKDEDDGLTLDQLGERALGNNFKTTGDEEFTAWQVLLSELSDSVTVDCDYLQRMKLKKKVPIAFCVDEKDISNVKSFVPSILVRVGKTMWELMDENDDHMEQLEWDGDNGVANLLGTYIKHPDEMFRSYFQTMTTVTKSADNNNDELVTP